MVVDEPQHSYIFNNKKYWLYKNEFFDYIPNNLQKEWKKNKENFY